MKHMNHKGKYTGDPAPSGKGGLKTKGETTSTKKALAHAEKSAKGAYEHYGRKH